MDKLTSSSADNIFETFYRMFKSLLQKGIVKEDPHCYQFFFFSSHVGKSRKKKIDFYCFYFVFLSASFHVLIH